MSEAVYTFTDNDPVDHPLGTIPGVAALITLIGGDMLFVAYLVGTERLHLFLGVSLFFAGAAGIMVLVMGIGFAVNRVRRVRMAASSTVCFED